MWTKVKEPTPGPKLNFQRTHALPTETNRRPVRSVHESRPIESRDPNDTKAPNDLEDRNDPDDLEDMNDLKARRIGSPGEHHVATILSSIRRQDRP